MTSLWEEELMLLTADFSSEELEATRTTLWGDQEFWLRKTSQFLGCLWNGSEDQMPAFLGIQIPVNGRDGDDASSY